MRMKLSEKINLLFSFLVTVATMFNILLWQDSKESLNNSKEELLLLRKQSQGSFIMDLNRDFFFDDRLYKVRKAVEQDRPLFLVNGGEFSIQDIDDYIGMFETMSGFIERDIIDSDLIDENFGYYIDDAFDNKEIQNYIVELRKIPGNEELYTGFEKLAKSF